MMIKFVNQSVSHGQPSVERINETMQMTRLPYR